MQIEYYHFGTCHSRWCPHYLPAFMDDITHSSVTAMCEDVAWTLQNHFNSLSDQVLIHYNRQWLLPACKLWCGEKGNQLLQLESAGVSRTVAVSIWVMVMLMMLSAFFTIVSTLSERGGRLAAKVGGTLFLAFIALIVSFITAGYDTIFYPIVGATIVASLSYLFSSFQYSIGVTYELASATGLVVSMFPVWDLLAEKETRVLGDEYHVIDRGLVQELIYLVFAMMIVSLLWIIHSSIYRTVMFKASWIAAVNRQKTSEARAQRKDHISGLWILSGAQGHPTWRTPTGQSFGLYLTVLSWVVAVKIQVYYSQEKYCKEDLYLFYISLWAPPVILTAAVLVTQACMCRKASCDVEGNNKSSLMERLMVEGDFLKESKTHMEEALISYRLGRDTLGVEDINEVREYKIDSFCRVKVDEKWLATILWVIEYIFLICALPGIWVCKFLQWLGIRILRYFPHIAWLKCCQRSSDFSLSEKIKAYRIVCECCSKAIKLNGGTSNTYDRSEEKSIYERSKTTRHDLQDSDIDEALCTMLRNRGKHIKLSLVLDNIGPSGFLYLLARLVEVLNEESTVPGGAMADSNRNVEEAPNAEPIVPGGTVDLESNGEEVENPRITIPDEFAEGTELQPYNGVEAYSDEIAENDSDSVIDIELQTYDATHS